MAARLELSESNIIESIRLAWGIVGPTVVTIAEVEAALMGKPLCTEALTELAPVVSSAVNPIDDVRASAADRRMVSGQAAAEVGGVWRVRGRLEVHCGGLPMDYDIPVLNPRDGAEMPETVMKGLVLTA